MQNRKWNKVFEVGSPKTGTSSLGKAFELLGLNHCGWHMPLYLKFENGAIEEALTHAENFDAFQDGPWHDIDIELLDLRFPNSKYILLERDDASWIKSYKNHFGAGWTDPDHALAHKKKKYRRVREYLKDRPGDLLEMNIIEGDGWDKLCPFLDTHQPAEQFPVENMRPKTLRSWIRKTRLITTFKIKRRLSHWKNALQS